MAAERNPERLLDVENLDVAYDAIRVVWGLSLSVRRGEVVTIIGANGAGKTTTLKAIAGLIPARSGKIAFDSHDLTSKSANDRVRHHLSLIPEGRQLWSRMTVEENLLMGAFPAHLRSSAYKNLERIYDLFPRLKERRAQFCGTLSGGEQQMCAIGRGLMAEPLLLLLDEPSLGLAPILVDQVFQLIRRIAAEGVTILLAAQNANYALQISNYTYVMEWGRVLLEGPSDELRSSDHVRRAYLGATA
ncbi:MAG TPA: ABC transporter ATP-binding protein [Candidatus Angelobacter sp.]|jgi:branched-chain amino acid transport system ATP-binding protein|nr:ABC transporter ATP-binding protein [Candidatus Angelobacter sp.]